MKHSALCPIVLGYDEQQRPLRLSLEDWCTGVHVIGAPGSGKSRFLQGLVRQIVRQQYGGLVIDPHGELYRSVLAYLAKLQPRRPIYLLDFSGGNLVYGFNPFRLPPNGDVSTQVSRLRQAILKVWGQRNIIDTPLLARWLKNSLAVLLERTELTLADVNELFFFQNKELRTYVAHGTSVESHWQELNHFPIAGFEDKVGSTRNRLDVLTSATVTRRFLALKDTAHTLDLERAMAERALVLVNLQPSPVLDSENARLLGVLLLTQLYDAVRQRPVGNGRTVPPFFTIVDEVQTVPSPDLPFLFAEARKFSAPLIVAHQYLHQLEAVDPDLLAAVHGAARTKVVFALGSADDAAVMADEVFPGAINFTETKYEHRESRFRPVDVWREVRTHNRGGNTGTTRSRGQSEGDTVTHGTSRQAGVSRAFGVSRSSGRNRTVSNGISVGEAVAIGHAVTRSVSETDSSSSSSGTSRMAGDRGGSSEMLGSNESQSRGSSKTQGYAETDSVTRTSSHSRNRSVATGETRGLSESQINTESTSSSTSRSHARQRVESVSEGQNEGHSWSESVSSTPGVRHDEYIASRPDFFTLEEQRTRRAFELRLQPQRHFTLRRPTGEATAAVAPSVADIRLPEPFVRAYGVKIAKKVGALAPEQVDQDVAERRLRLNVAARNFDRDERQALDLKEYDEQRTKRLTRKEPRSIPKPIRKNKPPSETPTTE